MYSEQPQPWELPDGIGVLETAASARLEQLRHKILTLFHSWGYDFITPPLVNFASSLPPGRGEDLHRQSFTFTDPVNGNKLVLRADITPQTACIDARQNDPGLSRLCYAGPVVQRFSRYWKAGRELYQAGAELYGSKEPEADLQIILLMLETAVLAGCHSICLDLGNVGIWRELSTLAELSNDQEKQIFAALQSKSRTELKRVIPSELPLKLRKAIQELPHLHGDSSVIAAARKILPQQDCRIPAMLDQLAFIEQSVKQQSNAAADCYIDLAELRGYQYHTGIVFAVYTAESGEAVAHGGRFDNMGSYFGRARPAVGFSTELLRFCQQGDSESSSGKVAVAASLLSKVGCRRQIEKLRSEGRSVIFLLPAEPIPRECTHQLQYQGGKWRLPKLKRNQ